MVSAGLLITDGERFLAERPFGLSAGKHCFDLPKGHVEKFDVDYLDAAFREAKEETGYDFDSYKDLAHALMETPVDYIEGKKIFLYMLVLDELEMPDVSEYKCESFFRDKTSGNLVPEVVAYEYKPLSEIRDWLFRSYSHTFDLIGLF